jgi:hypothetical protein
LTSNPETISEKTEISDCKKLKRMTQYAFKYEEKLFNSMLAMVTCSEHNEKDMWPNVSWGIKKH